MSKTRFYLFLCFLFALTTVAECGIFGSILGAFGIGKNSVNLTRTCFLAPKNLHQSVMSNDCHSVQNDPSMPINKLAKSEKSDNLRKEFYRDIDVNWPVENFYKSPYSGKRTGLRYSFAISYADEPLENKLFNPVEPGKKYVNNTEMDFALQLTKLIITGKTDNNFKSGKFVLKKNVKPSIKAPKFIRCDKPVSFKIRFYTMEVEKYRDVDYMYIIYKGKIGC